MFHLATKLCLVIVMFLPSYVDSQTIQIEDARVRGNVSALEGTIEVRCGLLWYTSCLVSYLADEEKTYVCNQHYRQLYKHATDSYHTNWDSVENGTINEVVYILHNKTCSLVTECVTILSTACEGLKASKPVVSVGDSTAVTFRENTVRAITCKVNGGIPAPIVRLIPRQGANLMSEPTSWTTKENTTDPDYPEQLVFYTEIMVNLSHEDNGAVYTCEANQTNFETQRQNVTLNVLYAPIIELPLNVTVNEGATVIIECMVNSNPFATVGWYEPDGTKKSNLTIMSLPHVTPVDIKNYSCIAENRFKGLTFTTSKKTELYVNYIRLPDEVIGKEHENFWINCTVVSYTEVTEVIWSDKTKTIISNTSILSLRNLSRDNEGHYTCKSRHRIGSAVQTMEKTTMLYVAYPPVVEAPSNFTTKEKDDVTLNCLVESYPISTVTWHSGDGMVVSNRSILELKNVDHTSTGNYTCRAQNTIQGVTYTDSKITSLFIYFAPIINVSQNTTGVEFENLAITCEVISYPLSNVIWKNQNSEKVSNTSTLRLNNVRATDAGVYTCTAENVIQHNLYVTSTSTTLYITRNPKCYVPNISRVNQHCRCNKRCSFLKNIRNITTEELVRAMEQTKKELTVDRSTLTLFIIKKISMKDARSSSIGLGVIGIVVILLSFGFLSSGDFIGLLKHFENRMKRNAKKGKKRRKRKSSGSNKKKSRSVKMGNDSKKTVTNSDKENNKVIHAKCGRRDSSTQTETTTCKVQKSS